MILRRETAAEQALHVKLGRAAHGTAAPGFACHFERFGPIERGQRERVARAAAVGKRGMPVEETDEVLRGGRFLVECCLGAALKQFLLGEIGVGGDEPGIGGKGQVVARGEIFPLANRLVHLTRLLRHEAAATGLLRLRSGGESQCGTGHQCDRVNSFSSHAGHSARPLLIRR